MNPITLTLLSVSLISIVSFIGVAALAVNARLLKNIIFVLVSLAVGALLGDAFIHLIPNSFAESSNTTYTGGLIIAGVLIFFIVEKLLHWHHLHSDHEHDTETLHDGRRHLPGHTIHPTGYMILASDGFHNFLDGIIIGISFLAGVEIGIASTVAIILHEIPQEIGDFGVLLHSGFSRGKALLLNFASALLAVLGGVLALVLGSTVEAFVPFIVPVAAGGFLYIATADLIPELRKHARISQAVIQLAAIIVGVAAMVALIPVEEYLEENPITLPAPFAIEESRETQI